MILFELHRKADPVGVSGVGKVAIGAEFYEDGPCIFVWKTGHGSLVTYDELAKLEEVHCHGKNSEVKFVQEFSDPEDEKALIEALPKLKGFVTQFERALQERAEQQEEDYEPYDGAGADGLLGDNADEYE